MLLKGIAHFSKSSQLCPKYTSIDSIVAAVYAQFLLVGNITQRGVRNLAKILPQRVIKVLLYAVSTSKGHGSILIDNLCVLLANQCLNNFLRALKEPESVSTRIPIELRHQKTTSLCQRVGLAGLTLATSNYFLNIKHL